MLFVEGTPHPEFAVGSIHLGYARALYPSHFWKALRRSSLAPYILVMCNLYSLTKGQAAIIALARAFRDGAYDFGPLALLMAISHEA
jgi:hypothetical protein